MDSVFTAVAGASVVHRQGARLEGFQDMSDDPIQGPHFEAGGHQWSLRMYLKGPQIGPAHVLAGTHFGMYVYFHGSVDGVTARQSFKVFDSSGSGERKLLRNWAGGDHFYARTANAEKKWSTNWGKDKLLALSQLSAVRTLEVELTLTVREMTHPMSLGSDRLGLN